MIGDSVYSRPGIWRDSSLCIWWKCIIIRLTPVCFVIKALLLAVQFIKHTMSLLTPAFALLVSIASLIFFAWRKKVGLRENGFPPGPPALLFLGNVHQLPRAYIWRKSVIILALLHKRSSSRLSTDSLIGQDSMEVSSLYVTLHYPRRQYLRDQSSSPPSHDRYSSR